AADDFVTFKCVAGRAIAGAKAKRSLIQEGGVSELPGRPALSLHDKCDKPSRGQKHRGEGISLPLLPACTARCRERRAPKNVIVVETRLVTHVEMGELMGPGESLHRQWSLGRNQDTKF